MGVDRKKLSLPAPTDSGEENDSVVAPTDLATDVSRRTDRTSYSIPEDGTPITLPTKKIRTEKSGPGSQASLLIEYFESSRSGEKNSGRPSVRVKVTPSGKHSKHSDSVKITELGTDRKPSYTRRIPLGTGSRSKGLDISDISDSNLGRRPIEIEVMNPSELSSDVGSGTRFIQPHSDISSMPADSMLEGPTSFKYPARVDSPEKAESRPEGATTTDSLKAPSHARDRSKSKERITQKVLEKLAQQQDAEEEVPSKKKVHKRRTASSSTDAGEEDHRQRSRRSSRSHRESDPSQLTESSLLPGESSVSGLSRSSINPKLLQTVEDVVRRLILPEIETIKRRQSVREDKGNRESYTTNRDSYTTESTDPSRHLSKSSSAPHIKPKVVLNQDENDPGVVLSGDSTKVRKHRRSSKESGTSEKIRSRRESEDSVAEEKERHRRHRDASSRTKEATGAAVAGELTAAALRSHNSRSTLESPERDKRERRKKRSKSHSRTHSAALTQEEHPPPVRRQVPRLPMNSEIGDSDFTRESILSAETADTAEPTQSSPSVKKISTPVRDVARDSPRTVESKGSARTLGAREKDAASPRTVRSYGELSSKQSDRSISSSKARKAALAAAGFGGASSALYGHDREPSRDRALYGKKVSRTNDRELSPARSETSDAKQDVERNRQEDQSPTQERGIAKNSMSDNRDSYLTESDGFSVSKDRSAEGRRNFSWDNSARRDSDVFQIRASQDSLTAPGYGEAVEHQQQLRGVGANPDITHTPQPVESRVASLLDPSIVSSWDAHSAKHSSVLMSPGASEAQREAHHSIVSGQDTLWETNQENHSAERWAALRGNAQQRSADLSIHRDPSSPGARTPAGGSTRTVPSQDMIQLSHSGVPLAHDQMPEIGHGMEDDIITNPSLDERPQSILEGPLGDEHERGGQWPYEPTPPANRTRSVSRDEDLRGFHLKPSGTDAMGAPTGLGIGGTSQAAGMRGSAQPRDLQSQSSASREGSSHGQQYSQDRNVFAEPQYTPGNLKDEGYISAANPRSPGISSPLSFSKPPPRLFDDDQMMPRGLVTRNADSPLYEGAPMRQVSGDSHGMSSPIYDSATGKGINNIHSKDVVALMDHLTVRDGHRNARDTEILVTLVRSAAEMRTSFEDMKKFIEQQNAANIQKTDANVEKTVNKVVAGSKVGPTGSPRTARSATGTEETPTKRKNIFQRALKGLSSRNSNDLGKMEDMLMQLLDEVEALRAAQGMSAPSVNQARDLDSYERLRVNPDSGYEPDGQAGTSSTPNRSGNLTMSPQPRQTPRMHSGYEARGVDSTRISTVLEDDEESQGHDIDEDRMLTPTQEAQQQRTAFLSPQSQGGLNDNTPPSGERYGKHKSSGSASMFGIPKISRWSKTTTSTAPGDRSSYRNQQAYTEGSRSGSQVDILAENGPYSPADEDRLRSSDSLAREDAAMGRTPSPLLPGSRLSLEDAKYHANRHSLTLEHPQPRQGPTQTQRSMMETQAQELGYLDPNGHISPPSDTFGSVPSLARFNRFNNGGRQDYRTSAGALSPASSDGGNSVRSRDSGRRHYTPSKLRDDGPLLPSNVDENQKHDQGYGRYDGGDDDYSSEHSEDLGDLDDDDAWIEPVPLPRKQSPYSPGGLLAPIEERYSLEQARSTISGTPAQERARIDDDRRSETPKASPRPAMGAFGGETARKITGPREMPAKVRTSSRG